MMPSGRSHMTMRKKLAWGLCAAASAWTLGFGLARISLANDSAGFNRNYTITNAASIYVTPRGQQYFSDHKLVGILQRNGVDLAHGKLPDWRYDAEQAFDLSHLPAGLKPYQSTLNSVRGAFRDWLVGFDLRNPVFHAQVREAGYDLDGLDLSLRVDPELTASFSGAGIGVILEAAIPHLRVYAKDICGYDSANTVFGTCRLDRAGRFADGFGVRHPWLELRDAEPLRFSVPVRVQIHGDGRLEIEAIAAGTNLEKLKFASGQDRDLVLPKVQIQVGSRTSTVNAGPLVTELMAREQDLVRLGIHHLHDFVVQELPARLSGMAFDQLKQGFGTVEPIDPPGIDTFHDGKKFEWGLRPSALALESGRLRIGLDGFVADPDLTWDEHLPRVPSPLPPVLAGKAEGDYDVALAINDFVIQRVLWLAYTRGSLPRIDLHDADDHCKVKQHAVHAMSPMISAGSGNHARMDVRLQIPRDGSVSEWFALKDPFQVEVGLDLRADLSTDPAHPNGFDLAIDHVMPDQSRVDPRTIDHSPESVAKGLRKALTDTTCGSFATKLTDVPIDVPADLFGIPFKLVGVEFDPHGYLVLYMSYGDRHP